jgi:4-hydroxy-4-methyl-2-oxoglutarate aldolase
MTDTNVSRAAKLDTATLSDALDRLGIVGQSYKIAPCDPGFRMAGRAFTVLYGPAAKPSGTVGDFIDDVAPGSVIVLDNDGREDVTVWGDILTEIAHRRGIAGTVIDASIVTRRCVWRWAIRFSAKPAGCAPAKTGCKSRPHKWP